MDDLEFGTKTDEFQQIAEEYSNRVQHIRIEKSDNISGNKSIRRKLKKMVFFLSGIVAAGVISTNSPSQYADAIEMAPVEQREDFPYLYEMEPMFEQLVYMLDGGETYQNIYIELEKHADDLWNPIIEQYAEKTNGMPSFVNEFYYVDYYYIMEEHEFYHLNNNLLKDKKRGLVLSFNIKGGQLWVHVAYASLFNDISNENDIFLGYYYRQDNASAYSSLGYLLGDFDEQFSSKTVYEGLIHRYENEIFDGRHIEGEVKNGYYVWIKDRDGNKKMFPKDQFDNYIVYNIECDFNDIKDHSELPVGVYLFKNDSEVASLTCLVNFDGSSTWSNVENISSSSLLMSLRPYTIQRFHNGKYYSFLGRELVKQGYVIQDCPFPLPVE